MDPDRLAFFPFVIVRVGCTRCRRHGAYRLARLAAKFGAEIALPDLIVRLSYDCPWRGDERNKASNEQCEARFVDLDAPRPPDYPPSIRAFKVVRGGKA